MFKSSCKYRSLERVIPAEKKPYLVRGTPHTILYLTPEHAAGRFDLIPQFQQIPLGPDS